MRVVGPILAALALCAQTAPVAQPASRPNVVLVTLDTTRADRIGTYGYALAETPALDRLAREGVRFDDATAQSPLTAPAHAALLTGQYPGRLGVRNNASSPIPESAVTLAESLRGAGYRTGAFIGAFVVDRAYGFAQGFDVFDAAFTGFRQEIKGQVQRPAKEVVDPALAFIAAETANEPFFAWIHLYDAHTPYDPPPPYNVKFAKRPYDGEIAYADAQFGRIVSALRASGVLDRTIVAVVGDHGEALGDHGEDDHGIFLYEAVTRVPWIMRLPNGERAGSVVAEQVRQVDLTPTVLDLAGARVTARTDGESVAALIRGTARRDPPPSYTETWYPELHFGWSRLRALRVGEWKYIAAPKPELYDLRTDRAERRNVIGERSSVASRMAGELEAIERGFGAAATTTPPQPDADTIARLRSLGYIGLAAPPSGGRGADPKDRIGAMREFRALLTGATGDLKAGRHDAALGKLKKAVALNERAYDAHVLLGSAYQQKGDLERAVGEFDAAALLNPVMAAPHVLAADVYLGEVQLQRAMERADKAAALEPNSGEVAALRGKIFERAGRGNEALAEYQRAIALNPSDTAARGRLAGLAMNMGRHDVAEPQLRTLLKLKYQPARTHFALGKLAEARGDRTGAATEYKRALALEPGLLQAKQALSALGGRQ
jgi:arylsulfatase A-like enzyme/tetratricopeptide (TPR) repeat protein